MSRGGAGATALATALVMLLAACGAPADAAPDVPPTVPARVLASASAAAAAVPRDEDLVWAPQGWPDACTLVAPSARVTPGRAEPGAADLPGGRTAGPPVACTWPVSGPGLPPPRASDGGTRLTLRVHVVTDDPYDRWGVLRFRLGMWRDVENVGDEAMLTMPAGDEREELYVCTGRTIFVLSVTGPVLEVQTQRDLLYDVALGADARLRAMPAGLSPDGSSASPPGPPASPSR